MCVVLTMVRIGIVWSGMRYECGTYENVSFSISKMEFEWAIDWITIEMNEEVLLFEASYLFLSLHLKPTLDPLQRTQIEIPKNQGENRWPQHLKSLTQRHSFIGPFPNAEFHLEARLKIKLN